MDKIFLNNVGDLGEVQRASYYRFLSYGIIEELAFFPNPFIAFLAPPTREKKQKIVTFVYIYPEKIKLQGPKNSIDNCIRCGGNYTLSLFVGGEYSYEYTELDLSNLKNEKENSEIQQIRVQQDIYFGEIPLMTEEGTFVLNGCERVVISQIIRSPGVYFHKERVSKRRTVYVATLISNKGLWTKFIFDSPFDCLTPKQQEEAERNPNKTIFLDRIYIKFNDYNPSLSLKDDLDDRKDEKKVLIYDIIRYLGLNPQELHDNLKYPEVFDIHKQRRVIDDLNQKKRLEDELEENEENALVEKLYFDYRSSCFSIGEVGRYKLNRKFGLNLPKTVTYLTALDLIKIIDGLMDMKYSETPDDDIDHIKNKQIRAVGELLQNQIRVGFYRLAKNLAEKENTYFSKEESTNSKKLDRWILDPRPMTAAFREFFLTSQLSQYLDQTNPLAELTHKRRISVFGPNGLKRDHISTVIRDIHPSQYGRLCPVETPEGQNAGLITSFSMYARLHYLGWIETPYFYLKENALQKIIYLNPENESNNAIAFGDIKLTKDRKITEEYLSVKENIIFLKKKLKEISFLTTTPLQIISLATSLIPFIEHNDANRALMGSNMQRQAVPLMHAQKAIVGTGLETSSVLDSGLIVKSLCEGNVLYACSYYLEIEDLNYQKISYYLRKYMQSNQDTCLNQRPSVWAGEKVFSGQVIADGPSTLDGELALGKNLIVAYMPWDGFNYEDAIVLNERLVFDDSLSSIHIEEHEILINYRFKEFLTKSVPYASSFIRRNLNKDGIVKIGSYVKENDILVGKVASSEEDSSPYAKLLKAIYRSTISPYRDLSLKVPSRAEGRVIDIRIFSSNSKEKKSFPVFTDIIRIYIAQIRKVQIGDKLSGRHGNKGIISTILPRQDMPYLPDGTPVDIVLNPLGVPSRMNVGQVFESLLGLAGEKLGRRFKVSPFDEIYGREASRILVNQKLKEAALQTNIKWLFNSSYPGKIMLRDGRTGEYFDNPITVGRSYILKLIHLVEDKIHARATGPYAMITEQPLAGKAQNGGQRFGEMEVWALEAYGCSNTLQELLTVKSDDIDGRNDMYESLLVQKNIIKPNPSIPESFLALMRELNALGLDFSMRKFTQGFYSTTSAESKEKDIFKELEKRLKLRELIERKKAELLPRIDDEDEKKFVEEKEEEKKILSQQIKSYWKNKIKK
jgi:DNA-directed RNA polymerase subunit beta